MVYFSNEQIIIRNMEDTDAQAITDAEIEQGRDAAGRLAISIYIPTVCGVRLAGKVIRKLLISAFWKNIGIRTLVQF